jgi:hypothetical protein
MNRFHPNIIQFYGKHDFHFGTFKPESRTFCFFPPQNGQRRLGAKLRIITQ